MDFDEHLYWAFGAAKFNGPMNPSVQWVIQMIQILQSCRQAGSTGTAVHWRHNSLNHKTTDSSSSRWI
ncbi:hypothetical protein Q3G72_033532 [Acer saccharum]|nr:hypothetical protein Q3G72_033532 [Acer saccharum]